MTQATWHRPVFPSYIKTLWFVTKIILLSVLTGIIALISGMLLFESRYRGKIYPGVTVGGVPFAGQTPEAVADYWTDKNEPFRSADFEFRFENSVATVSGTDLDAGYDAALSAKQAYLIGRSGNILTDLRQKFFTPKSNLNPYFRWREDVLNQLLENLAIDINIDPREALFTFANGKVTAFRPSSEGRRINITQTKDRFNALLSTVPISNSRHYNIVIAVETVLPSVTTDRANTFGIKEQIGRGYSEFAGSISGRIHNVALAAARFNGVLIAPGEVLSFNKTLGDVSAATGYQQAYIIKEGHTILGDGGGVCQVSTTLFRAALEAGLPILERNAHAYRVHYYEEGGYKPGLDATVFDPSADFKIKNDTPSYILIQTKTDLDNLNLIFELYGKKDGRVAQIYDQKLWGVTPPPADLYQDDPTLPKGTVKQVDFSAWGAKASFAYKVTRGDQVLQDTVFYSNYRPWQAVFLKGTKE